MHILFVAVEILGLSFVNTVDMAASKNWAVQGFIILFWKCILWYFIYNTEMQINSSKVDELSNIKDDSNIL